MNVYQVNDYFNINFSLQRKTVMKYRQLYLLAQRFPNINFLKGISPWLIMNNMKTIVPLFESNAEVWTKPLAPSLHFATFHNEQTNQEGRLKWIPTITQRAQFKLSEPTKMVIDSFESTMAMELAEPPKKKLLPSSNKSELQVVDEVDELNIDEIDIDDNDLMEGTELE